jgi:isoleucyl-tRNA synthetase
MEDKNAKNPYQSTLNLPQTEFAIRANAQIKEPELLKRWEDDGLAAKATIKNKGKKKFILHDGPPYANGNLHIGHALTYILKDMVCKSKRMDGFHAPLIPGWDCHGLPIELKVTNELGLEGNRHTVDRIEFKKACRAFANKWIAVQDKELKELGKLADYEHPYITMSPGYEADIVRAFSIFVEKGHIERKLKTVPWCGSCETVLATAEIEYKDRKDPSIYVLFPLPDETARLTFPFLFEQKPNIKLNFVVWTTTPWTLPLNRAVVLNPTAVYSVLRGRDDNEAIIVAKELADKLCATAGLEKIELAEADSVVFTGKRAEHPFIPDFTVPILLDQSVLVSEGTACMHSAPGCGPEDYLLGIKNNLEIFSPLSASGRYTVGIVPAELENMPIVDGQIWVIRKLAELNRMLFKNNITHSYPHCWRCRNGLMFRATNQWFCDLQKNNLVERTLAQLDEVQFVPDRGRARLRSFIANRPEWCISRQRQWGVPITAVLCSNCEWAFLDVAFINAVADHIAKEGVEFWDRMTPQSLQEMGLLPAGFACGKCGNNDLSKCRLERDILDVWFDSGASSFAVLSRDLENLSLPADLYFEGSDQHRGWFQSSMLCGMILYGHSPTKAIATHGYVVDEQKRKMSKSLGNGVSPTDVMAKHSRDILRMWVAGADYEGDLVISEKLLQNVSEMYRKVRNTCRYMLANLNDYDHARDAVPVEQLLPLDQYALTTLHELDATVRENYNIYCFSAVVQAINNYCTNTLSAVYLDILKDRLYVEKPASLQRRSAQTVLYHMLETLTHLFAPVLSFLAEEVTDTYQKNKTESVHLQTFVPVPVAAHTHRQAWQALEALRGAVLKSIEPLREQGVVKHPYEAGVKLVIDPSAPEWHVLEPLFASVKKQMSVEAFLQEWFIVSSVELSNALVEEGSALPWAAVESYRCEGLKCPRCWQWTQASHEDGLCKRCDGVLNG